jgi:hypothetical protein
MSHAHVSESVTKAMPGEACEDESWFIYFYTSQFIYWQNFQAPVIRYTYDKNLEMIQPLVQEL